MGSAASDSKSSSTSGSDRSLKARGDSRSQYHSASVADDGRPEVRLHISNCDKMYRWAMWRMQLNEQIARAAHGRSIVDVTSPYLHHPDGRRFGHMMKKKFKSSRLADPRSEHILPDNFYLVFGLPRVSLSQNMPVELKELHASVQEKCLRQKNDTKINDSKAETEKQITALFDFIPPDAGNTESSVTVHKTNAAVESDQRGTVAEQRGSNIENEAGTVNSGQNLTSSSAVDKQTSKGSVQTQNDAIGISKSTAGGTVKKSTLPLASKSRLFWQQLAERKSEIIAIEKTDISKKSVVLEPPKGLPTEYVEKNKLSKTHQSATTNGHIESEISSENFMKNKLSKTHQSATTNGHTESGISSEILLKQHKLLKKTTPKARSSKDLWKSLADRKTEILLLQETNADDSSEMRQKRNERKTSNLWGFIFSKKKDLVHMKKGNKSKPDKQPSITYISDNQTNKQTPLPATNFQDNFQSELEAKLRRRRENVKNNASSISDAN